MNDVSSQFRREFPDLFDAHESTVQAIMSCIARFDGRELPGDLDEHTRDKISQSAQLSALFLQGIEPCETCIVGGRYFQGSSLLRQQLEAICAIDEVWLDRRNPKKTPRVSSLATDLRRAYGYLSELTHASVPDHLRALQTERKGEKIGARVGLFFHRELADFLLQFAVRALLEFAFRQDHILTLGYGCAFEDDEISLIEKSLRLAEIDGSEIGRGLRFLRVEV